MGITNITLLQGSQALSARPSDGRSMKIRTGPRNFDLQVRVKSAHLKNNLVDSKAKGLILINLKEEGTIKNLQ